MATPNFDNRTLYHGDNLDFLRGMNSESVHLIATDPPFNKGRDFHATPDSLASGARFQDRWSWDRDVHPDWVEQIKDDWPAVHSAIEASKATYGEDIAAFLCFMGVRLIEMHRVLRSEGSLYLHCDPTASHYLKTLMDAVFGRKHFRNEIIWKRTSTKSLARRFAINTDRILYYVKTDSATWNQQYTAYDDEYAEKNFPHEDEHGRWGTVDLSGGKAGSAKAYMPLKGIRPPPGRAWAPPTRDRFPDLAQVLLPDNYETLDQLAKCEALDDAGLLHWPKGRVGRPRWKKYLSTMRGVVAGDLVLDTPPAKGKERTGFPTQKPLALYERIIRASSHYNDIVLDPFCGCATTPIAAERLECQWVGMDIWNGAIDVVRQRMEDNRQLIQDIPEIHYETEPPERTDEGEIAAPILRLRLQRPTELWQRLTHAQIVEHLLDAQKAQGTLVDANQIVCAGCGRILEREFMELDHIQPRAEGGANDITNRILLCRPCNGRKSADLTLRGLIRENRRQKWMQSEGRANVARDQARLKADMVSNGLLV